MKYLRFLVASLCWAGVMELWFNYFIHENIGSFGMTMGIYVVAFSSFYLLTKMTALLGRVSYAVDYALFGAIGLAIEWFMLENAPWINPTANQFTMFVFWGGIALVGNLYARGPSDLQKKFAVVFLGYAVIGTILCALVFTHPAKVALIVYIALFYDFGNIYFMQLIVRQLRGK